MSSEQAAMESGGCPHHHEQRGAKKVLRVARAVYLVLVKGLGKHQPKLAALGVHLHEMLSKRGGQRGDHGLDDLRVRPALTYLSSMSCRSMDPQAAVHPYPRGAHGGAGRLRRGTSVGASGLSSMSCRSMDSAAAVSQYQYRPREVEFSCSSTPLHKRRRAQRRMRLQHGAAVGHDRSSAEYYGSAATVSRLFELMDVKEAAEETDGDDEDGDLVDSVVQCPAVVLPAPRQVRITDSPFPAWEEDDEEGRLGVVDRRADEFIMWFHEQLRMQQQQRAATKERSSYYLVR